MTHGHMPPASQILSDIREAIRHWEDSPELIEGAAAAESVIGAFQMLDRHLCDGGALPDDWKPVSLHHPGRDPGRSAVVSIPPRPTEPPPPPPVSSNSYPTEVHWRGATGAAPCKLITGWDGPVHPQRKYVTCRYCLAAAYPVTPDLPGDAPTA
jgi:hypothetical protein